MWYVCRCTDWRVTAPLPFGERRDQLAAEGGDVGDDAAPDQVTLAEGRLVHPGRPGVLQVVLYAQRARRADTLYYPGRDRDEATVADDADGLVLLVDAPDEGSDLRVAPQLVRSPATGDDDPIELRGIHVAGGDVRLCLQSV